MTNSESKDGKYIDNAPHNYYAQLTNSHCRWLGESYVDKNGAKRLFTFLDGDDFISEWGYGEDNLGSETHLAPHGVISRNGNTVSVSTDKHIIDVVGRYKVKILKNEFDTVCTMEYFENGALTEQYKGFMVGASGCALCNPCTITNGEPCKFPNKRYSCMSAYCIYVKDLAEKCGMVYDYKEGALPFFSMYVYD